MNEKRYCMGVQGFFLGSLDFLYILLKISQVKSSQVTFIYIALLTIQIVTKQLHNIKMGK